MKQWTYEEIRDKVEEDLDLQEETFVSPTQLMEFANDGIDICEAEIHKLCEDYFLTRDTFTIASGTDEYDMPDDIYANKIRGMILRNGATTYPIKRVKGSKMFEVLMDNEISPGDNLRYLVTNSLADGPKIVVTPVPGTAESGATVARWYIRNARRIEDDTDVIDLPECANTFVQQYMKVRCMAKESHPDLAEAKQELQAYRDQMVEILSEMIPDTDNEMEMDLSHYAEAA